jgi:hypothetical protein
LRPELEATLADPLVDEFTYSPIRLGAAVMEDAVERDAVTETNPIYLGVPFVVRIPIEDGSDEWLGFWPPDAHATEPHERVSYDRSHGALIIRVYDDGRDDPRATRARQFVTDQEANLRRLVDATNKTLAAWNDDLPNLCRQLVAAERRKRQEREERKQSFGLPIVSTSTSPVPYPLPRRRASRVRLDPSEYAKLGARPILPAEDFAEVLSELQRSALFLSEHPHLQELGEEDLRDLVLASLNAAFPGGGTAETFSKRGKTDIRVVTTLAADSGVGDCVFKAECKKWDGPATAVKALEQLCDRYLTPGETRSAIVLFVPPSRDRGQITREAVLRLRDTYICEEQQPVAAWPIERITNPPGLTSGIDLAIICL